MKGKHWSLKYIRKWLEKNDENYTLKDGVGEEKEMDRTALIPARRRLSPVAQA